MRKRMLLMLILFSLTACALMIVKLMQKDEVVKPVYYESIKVNEKESTYRFVDGNFEENGSVEKNSILALDSKEEIKDGYLKLKGSKLYIKGNSIEQNTNKEKEELSYQKYIPFKKSIKGDNLKLYNKSDNLTFTLDKVDSLPILIRDEDKYFVEFNNRLLYAKKSEVNLVENNGVSSQELMGKEVPVFMYHYFYNKNNNEKGKDGNWLEVSDFEKQLQYLNQNDYFTMNMEDLELFLDKKIKVPKKSVLLSMDDGHRSVRKYVHPLLDKYNVNASSFLITHKVKNINDYKTKHMRVYSHTHNMHRPGCTGGRGGLMRCIPVSKGIEDLNKSSEVLEGTRVLAYPFGDYTKTAFEILDGANYHMAFTIENGTTKPGMNKKLLPRIRISANTKLESFIAAVN